MRRWYRWSFICFATISLLAIVAWWLTWQPPHWYQVPDASSDAVARMADRAEFRLIEEFQKVRDADDAWHVRIGDEAINAWLAARLEAWLSHEHGSMSTEDMRASTERLKHIDTVESLASYGEGVRDNIKEFLAKGDTAAYDRVVPAHYGGEVTVLELLNIILSHSTHHLKQIYSFVEDGDGGLGLTLRDRATEEDLEGIATPSTLI